MEYRLGVDVGTTFTAAAIARDGVVEALPLGSYEVAVPSVVFADGDELLFAGTALLRGATEPAGLAREFKRRLGDPVPLILNGSPYHADRLTALMTSWVVGQVTEQLGHAPIEVALTHPANWSEFQLTVLRGALGDVGLPDVALLSEPTAAALDYAANAVVDDGALLLVYDLGGGTFDVALLRRRDDHFEQEIEPFGIERLGGIDFDEAIFQHVIAQVPAEAIAAAHEGRQGLSALAHLRRGCVEAKESLSSNTATDVVVMLPGHTCSVRITRDEFERMIRPMIDQTVTSVRRTIAGAGLGAEDLSAALMVGGSSRIPLVSRTLAEQLGLRVRIDAHPKLVTAKGAARFLSGRERPPPQPAADRTGGHRRRLLFGVVGGAAIAGAALGTWLLTRTDGSGGPPPGPGASVTYVVGGEIATDRLPLAVEIVGTDLWVTSTASGTAQRFALQGGSAVPAGAVDLLMGEPGSNQGNDIVATATDLYISQYAGGTVARVSLTDRRVERIRIGGAPSDEAELDGTVWVCVDNEVGTGALVPITGSTPGSPVPIPFPGRSVLPYAGQLWVAFFADDQLGVVDPSTGHVDTIALGGRPTDLLAVDDQIWVALTGLDQVVIVDPASMEIVRRIRAEGRPCELFAALGSVWVVNDPGSGPGSVARLDPESRRMLQPPIGVGLSPADLASDGERMYIANFGGSSVNATKGSVSVLQPSG